MRQPLLAQMPGIVAMLAIAAFLSGFGAPASAQLAAGVRDDDPAAHAAEHERLFQALAAADTEADARATELAIWTHWMAAPDLASARLMQEALDRRAAFDLTGSVAILDELVALTPDWAEGWNQRATVRFMQEDFDGSLADIEETLKREPKHFGALAGQALIFIRQGRARLAQSTLRQAVAIDPYLRERVLIVEAPGKEI
jgi:tetratricopeptide (TPR) repeat protein